MNHCGITRECRNDRNNFNTNRLHVDKLLTKNGIGTISKYADGVGLHFSMIINYKSTKNNIIYTDIIKYIKENNLESHIYTIRSDNTQIPDYAKNFQYFVSILQKANIDGIFTDFPDQI